MSRAASELFGAGDLDEVAIYKRTLGPTTIADHYNAIVPTGGGEGGEKAANGGKRRRRRQKKKKPAAAAAKGRPPTRKSVLGTPTLLHYWRMGEAGRADARRQQGLEPRDGDRRADLRRAGQPQRRRQHGRALRRRQRRRRRRVNLAEQLGDHGRVLAQVEQLRQRRPPGDGVHQQLQRKRGRLPGRPQRARSWAAPSASASARAPRATTSSSPGPRPASGTTTPSCSTPSAPADQQITPYVDGKAIAYTKLDSGTGAGNFANSTLNFMSRAGSGLFGTGELDEVSVFGSALWRPPSTTTSKASCPKAAVKKKKKKPKKKPAHRPPTPKPCSALPASTTTGAWARARGSVFADSVGPSPATIAGEPTLGVVRRDQQRRRQGGALRRHQRLRPAPPSTSRARPRSRSSSGSSGTATPTTTAWRWSSPTTSTKPPAASWSTPTAATAASRSASAAAPRATSPSSPGPRAGPVAPLRLRARHDGAGGRTGRALRRRQAGAATASPRAAPAPPPSPTRPRSTSCRARGTGLFGAGDLDEVALYGRALDAATIANHFRGHRHQQTPGRVLQRSAHGESGSIGQLRRLRLERPRRHDRQIRMGPRRQRHLRDRHRHDADRQPHLLDATAASKSACGSPTAAARPRRPRTALTIEGESGRGGPTNYNEARPRHHRACATTGAWARARARCSPTASDSARRPPPVNRLSASPAASSAIPTPRSASTASTTAAGARGRPLERLDDHGRVLAQVERLRQRRRPGDGAHQQLQRSRRRLPGRPEQQLRQLRRRHRQRAPRATSPSSPGPAPAAGTTTPSCSTRPRRRPKRSCPTSTAKRSPTARPKAAPSAGNFANSTLNFMSRAGSALLRQPATSTRWRSTTARSAPATIAGHYAVAAHNKPPEASFTAYAQPGADQLHGQPSTPRLDRPRRHRGQIRMGPRRQRDLRDQHGHDADRDTLLLVPGDRSIGLRVTDAKGATGTTTRTADDPEPAARRPPSPPRPNPVLSGVSTTLRRLRLERPRRHDRQIRVGPRRQRQLRDQHGDDADGQQLLRDARRKDRRPAGHRQLRRRPRPRPRR